MSYSNTGGPIFGTNENWEDDRPKFGSDQFFHDMAPAVVQHAQNTKSGTPDARPAPEADYSAAYAKSTPVDPDQVARSNMAAQQAQQSDTATQLAIQAQQAEQAKQVEAAQQAEAAKQANISSQNAQIAGQQNQANAMAGNSMAGLNLFQQTADSQAIANQSGLSPTPVFGLFGTALPTSTVASQKANVQSASGVPALAKTARINQLGPGAQNGFINSVAPSQTGLKFGGA